MEKIEYGTFTDSRDGQTYKTVKIGNQVWLAENFKFNVEKSCAPNGDEKNVAKYGRLYAWDSVYAAVPEGWHLPTRDEMKKFRAYLEEQGYKNIEGITLRSATGWKEAKKANAVGKDSVGFGALPAGLAEKETWYRDGEATDKIVPKQFGYYCDFWVIDKKKKQSNLGDWTPFDCRILIDEWGSDVTISDAKSLYNIINRYLSIRLVQDTEADKKKKSAKKKEAEAKEKAAADATQQFDADFAAWQKNPVPEFGSFVDKRNNRTYKTVKIGGLEWMAEDLQYADDDYKWRNRRYRDGDRCFYSWTKAMGIPPTYESKIVGPTVKKKIAAGNYQGIAPEGWHIPSLEECEYLIRCIGALGYENKEAIALKSKEGWEKVETFESEEVTCPTCKGEGIVKKESGEETECEECYGSGKVEHYLTCKNGDDAVGMNIIPSVSGNCNGFWSTSEDEFNTDRAYGIAIDGNNSTIGAMYLEDHDTPEDIRNNRYGNMPKRFLYSVRCVKNK